jgi:Tfp pilus assembly protein PilV
MPKLLREFLPPEAARRTRPYVPPQGAEGFSLLEVLVATTLMGLVLVVLLQVLTVTLRTQATAWGHTQALLMADKVLQENCQINSLAAGIYQGKDGPYAYQVRITPQYELASSFSNERVLCSVIQVTVSWQEWGQAKTLSLETVRTGVQKKS